MYSIIKTELRNGIIISQDDCEGLKASEAVRIMKAEFKKAKKNRDLWKRKSQVSLTPMTMTEIRPNGTIVVFQAQNMNI